MRFPKSWSDITIEQYQAAIPIMAAEFVAETGSRIGYEDEIAWNIDLLNALSGIPKSAILRLPLKKLWQAARGTDFIRHLDKIDRRFPLYFMLRGKVFKVPRRTDTISAAQMAELSSFCSSEPETLLNLHQALATVCLPLLMNPYGKRRVKRHQKTSEFFQRNLTMNIAWPIALFFCTVYGNLMQSTLESLLKETKVTLSRSPQSSLKNTAG